MFCHGLEYTLVHSLLTKTKYFIKYSEIAQLV